MPSPQEFKNLILGKYPDAVDSSGVPYAQLDPVELTKRVVSKYPNAATNAGIPYASFLERPTIFRSIANQKVAQREVTQSGDESSRLIAEARAMPAGPERTAKLRQANAVAQQGTDAAAQNQFNISAPIGEGLSVKKAGQSFVNFTKSAASGVANILNPDMETGTFGQLTNLGSEGLAKLVVTLANKIKPGSLKSVPTPMLQALGKIYYDRYGGEDLTEQAGKIVDTALTDPAAFLSDISLASAVAGGTAKLAAKGLGKAGLPGAAATTSEFGTSALSTAKNINPLTLEGQALKGATKGLYRLGRSVISQGAGSTTGAGTKAAQRVIDDPAGTNRAMSGKVTADDVVDDTQRMRNNFERASSKAYKDARTQLGLDETRVPDDDIAAIHDKMSSRLKELRVKETRAGLEFEDSYVRGDTEAMRKITTAWEETQRLLKKPTYADLDYYKRAMYGLKVNGQSPANSVTMPLHGEARTALGRLPGYNATMAPYQEAMEQLDDINRALSIGDKTNANTAANKLLNVLKSHPTHDMKTTVLQELVKNSGPEGQRVLSDIAGFQFRDWTSQRFLGQLTQGSVLPLAVLGRPLEALGLFLASSPQIVGRLLQAYGITGQLATRLTERLTGVSRQLSLPASAGAASDTLRQRFTQPK